ncbi:MAG: hypothetical protein KAJ63_12075 [Methyloprofundus sp.]|nr:hypothetical protein [Methyloprofundus sp.]
MSEKIKQKEASEFEAKITFSGAGVLHIKSSELVKTQRAKKQIAALGELKQKGFLASA